MQLRTFFEKYPQNFFSNSQKFLSTLTKTSKLNINLENTYDISKNFEQFNEILLPNFRMKNLKDSNYYEKYLFLERLSNLTRDQSLKTKAFSIKENLLKSIANNTESKHLNQEFLEFLFKINSKENFYLSFLIELYPKNLVINKNDSDNIINLIKLMQIMSKNSIKNEILMNKILELIEISSQKGEIHDRFFNKQISYLIMIFFKQNYLNKNTEKYLNILLNLAFKNLSEFDGESLSLLLYSISLVKIDKSIFKEGFLINITKNLLQKDFKSIRMGNLIRTLYNLFSIEIQKDNLDQINLLKKMIAFINENFQKIDRFFDLSFIGCILNKLENFPDKTVFIDELQLLSKKFCEVFFKKIIENVENSKKEIMSDKLTNQICTHLLLGLYTSSINLMNNYNSNKIDQCFLFLEKILIMTKFDDIKYFKHTVFYFAKSNQGSDEFWTKIEEDFQKYLPSMNFEDISYLTSSFRTNLPLKNKFWLSLEKRIIELLQKFEETGLEKHEKDFKNILYIISYHQKGSKKFWKYIENLLRKNETQIKPENLLKIVNYMKNISYIKDDFFLHFLKNPKVSNSINIIPFSMNVISLLEHGKFSEKETESELFIIKQIIQNKLNEQFFKDEDLSKFPMKIQIKEFCELCWIINKLDLLHFYFMNGFILNYYLENSEKFKKIPNDVLIKFVWVLFSLKFHKNAILFEKLEKVLLEKLNEMNSSMLSLITQLFGLNSCGSIKFWNSLLREIKFKFSQYNIQQIIISFCGITKNQNLFDFDEVIYEVFSRFLEEYQDYTKKQCEELLPCLKKIIEKEKLFIPFYLKLRELYENMIEDS